MLCKSDISQPIYKIELILFFSSRRRHTIYLSDWSSDVCSSDLVHFQKIPHTASVIQPCAVFGHLNVPPAPQRLTHHQLVADSLALVLVVHLGRAATSGSSGRSHFAE